MPIFILLGLQTVTLGIPSHAVSGQQDKYWLGAGIFGGLVLGAGYQRVTRADPREVLVAPALIFALYGLTLLLPGAEVLMGACGIGFAPGLMSGVVVSDRFSDGLKRRVASLSIRNSRRNGR